MLNKIKEIISASLEVKRKTSDDDVLSDTLLKVTQEMIRAFKADKKILFCGNGGSAADAQHIAAELSGRFYINRPPLYAEALHVNSSYLTAVANDYSYDEVFARMVQAAGRQGDILFGLSTSGNSPNVLRAVEVANAAGMITIGMTGSKGGKMKDHCTYLLNVPSDDTPRIQEVHILLGHILCELTEKELFGTVS